MFTMNFLCSHYVLVRDFQFDRKRSNGQCNGAGSLELEKYFDRQPDRSEWQAEFEKTLEWENRPSSSSSIGEIGFNEDLLCPHGVLSIFQQ